MTAPRSNATDLRGAVWAAWSAVALLMLSATRPDPDLWGHLRFGLDWWRTFTLPLEDPYSFTQDRPWINHEWLSETAMGAAYLAAGVPGLIVLKLAAMGIALGALAVRLRGATALVRAAVLVLAIAGAMPLSLTVRPQLWSVACLALLAALIDAPQAPGLKRIGAAALLFAVWANLHGGWITGAGALLAYCAVRTILRPSAAPRWAGMAAAGIGATLVNPYGIGLWRFLATTVRASRPDITEWQPLGAGSPLILWLPIASALLLAGTLSARRETRPGPAVWAVLILLSLAAIRVHRVAPLMGPASLVLLAPCVVRAWGSCGRLSAPNRQAAAVLWVPAAVALLAVAQPVRQSFACLPIESDWQPDLAAARSLAGARGRLITTFDWGEYAIWHFGPALRVSIDGRRETVYSDGLIQLHRRFERGEPAALEALIALRPDYIWLPSSRSATRGWLAAHGYRIDVETSASFIAVRESLPALAEPDRAASRCFP